MAGLSAAEEVRQDIDFLPPLKQWQRRLIAVHASDHDSIGDIPGKDQTVEFLHRGDVAAGDHDFDRIIHAEISRDQKRRRPLGRPRRQPGHDRQRRIPLIGKRALARDGGQPEEIENHDGGGSRRGAIDQIARPEYQSCVIGWGRVQFAVLGKSIDRPSRQAARLVQIPLIKTRLIEIDQPGDEIGVIFQKLDPRQFALTIGVIENVTVGHFGQYKIGGFLRRGQERVVAGNQIRLGEGGNRQTIPRGEDFVIGRRRDAFFAFGQKATFQFPNLGGNLIGTKVDPLVHGLGMRSQVQDVSTTLEIAVGGDAEVFTKPTRFRAQRLPDLIDGPGIISALFAFAVGILSGIETAFGVGHLRLQIAEDSARYIDVVFLARHLVGLEVRDDQQGVVVEHLLKMRHQPGLIDRISMEATGQVIVDSPVGHFAQSQQGSLGKFRVTGQMRGAKKKRQVDGVGEFRSAPETAEAAVERPVNGLPRRCDHVFINNTAGNVSGRILRDVLCNRLG